MMQLIVNMHKAKSTLSELVARAQAGEEVIITRAGKPVARLVAIQHKRVPGALKGKIILADDFEAPLPDSVMKDFESP